MLVYPNAAVVKGTEGKRLKQQRLSSENNKPETTNNHHGQWSVIRHTGSLIYPIALSMALTPFSEQ